MRTKRLNLVDMAWLRVESARAPMHVGGLLTFYKPADAPADFCQQVVDAWRSHSAAYRPWNQRLRPGRFNYLSPEWELLDTIDVDYHFRHSALPAPGGELELGTLTSRLHSHPLDFSRPPWECHLIEGLENERFAIYLKMHHSLIDGVAGMRLLARALAETPDEPERPPFWAIEPKQRRWKKAPEETPPGLYRAVAELTSGAREQVTSLPGFASVLRDMLSAARSKTRSLGLPFAAPQSILNGRIDATRRYATQLYPLSELRMLARAAGFRNYQHFRAASAERPPVEPVDLTLVEGMPVKVYISPLGEILRVEFPEILIDTLRKSARLDLPKSLMLLNENYYGKTKRRRNR